MYNKWHFNLVLFFLYCLYSGECLASRDGGVEDKVHGGGKKRGCKVPPSAQEDANGEVNQPEKVMMKRKLSSAISLLSKATSKMRTSKCLEEEMKTVVNKNTVQNNNPTCMKVTYYTQS